MTNDAAIDQELIGLTKLGGLYNQLLRDVVARRDARKLAERRGIAVTRAELQQASDEFRQRATLTIAAAFQKWLDNNDLTLEAYERLIEDSVLVTKTAVVEDGEIDDAQLDAVAGGLGGLPVFKPLVPRFNPYAEEGNAVAGVRG